MYETYLQNEKEFDEKFIVKSNAGTGLLRYTDADNLKSHRRLSRIKEMKALEKELEGEKEKRYIIEEGSTFSDEFIEKAKNASFVDKGLKLSLDKIREFIKLLEKEV